MGVEWGEQHSEALDELGALIDRVTEGYHRLRDSLRNPPRTKKARDLKRGDVVQFNDEARAVSIADVDGDRVWVWFAGKGQAQNYPAGADIVLASVPSLGALERRGDRDAESMVDAHFDALSERGA